MAVSGSHSLTGAYRGVIEKRVLLGVIFTLSLLVLSIFSLGIGTYSLSITEVLNAIFIKGTKASLVIWNIRLPRIIAAVSVGAGLAISGTVMQCLLKNPLASPFTMGISHGAMFGAAFAIGVLGAGSAESTGKIFVTNPYTVVGFAFAGAIFSMVVILSISGLRGLSPAAMILAGVAMSSLFTAATTLIQYFATEQRLAAMVYWSFGDLGRPVWKELLIISLIVVPSLIYFFIKRWDYNAMESGDETARTLGVDPLQTRLSGSFIASLVTASGVSLVGIIGFIGLVSPHVVRLLIGGDQRFLIPLSAIFGALLLLVSDTIARTIMAPVLLPVGVITSFMGAPMFIYLLIKAGVRV